MSSSLLTLPRGSGGSATSMRNISIVLIALQLLCGCTSMTLKYEADLETNGKMQGTVYATRTVDTTGHAVVCGVTFWIYGGWCWSYLFMPIPSQERELTQFVKRKVETDLHVAAYHLVDPQIFRQGWYVDDSDFHFKSLQPVAPPPAAPKPAEKVATDSIPSYHKPAAEPKELPVWRKGVGTVFVVVGVGATVLGGLNILVLGMDGSDTGDDEAYQKGRCSDRKKCHEQQQSQALVMTLGGIGLWALGQVLITPPRNDDDDDALMPKNKTSALAAVQLLKFQNGFGIGLSLPTSF